MVIIILFFVFYYENIIIKFVKLILQINVSDSNLLRVRFRNYNFPFEERIFQNKEVKYNKYKYSIIIVHPHILNDSSNYQIRVSANLKN